MYNYDNDLYILYKRGIVIALHHYVDDLDIYVPPATENYPDGVIVLKPKHCVTP